mmetsp:Transcript_17916/g.53098  ORF Transcript_17916/g.53098 Transcript_17916/m.53098 type:complete len:166 (+) Transcript_17916:52-549(+)
MHIKYRYMRSDVNSTATKLESKSATLVKSLDALAADGVVRSANLTAVYAENANQVVDTWWTLPDLLIAKYADGYLNDGSSIPYPDAWLNLTNFVHGPPPVPCPPCPCTPSYSPTCSQCCGKGAATVVGRRTTAAEDEERTLRGCIRGCDAAMSGTYRTCVQRCST